MRKNAQKLAKVNLSEAKQKYARDGYCIISDVLSRMKSRKVRQRIVEQAAEGPRLRARRCRPFPTQKELEDQRGALTENVSEIKGGVNQRMNMLLKRERSCDLVTRPLAFELCRACSESQVPPERLHGEHRQKGGMLGKRSAAAL